MNTILIKELIGKWENKITINYKKVKKLWIKYYKKNVQKNIKGYTNIKKLRS